MEFADSTTLMFQASDTINEYLRKARMFIDKEFGEGYAAKNPDLVAAFIKASAYDFNTAVIVKYIGGGLSEIAESIEALQSTITPADYNEVMSREDVEDAH
jgi:hypothetical protein